MNEFVEKNALEKRPVQFNAIIDLLVIIHFLFGLDAIKSVFLDRVIIASNYDRQVKSVFRNETSKCNSS